MNELWSLSLRQASDGFVQRKFSAVELLASPMDRLRATEPAVHADVTLIEGSPPPEAERAQRGIAGRKWRGPLHGIPVGVKDLCYTAGVKTEAGSRVLEGFVPDHDATVVRKLKDGGAVIVGKTVTHEFAYGQDVPPT